MHLALLSLVNAVVKEEKEILHRALFPLASSVEELKREIIHRAVLPLVNGVVEEQVEGGCCTELCSHRWIKWWRRKGDLTQGSALIGEWIDWRAKGTGILHWALLLSVNGVTEE